MEFYAAVLRDECAVCAVLGLRMGWEEVRPEGNAADRELQGLGGRRDGRLLQRARQVFLLPIK